MKTLILSFFFILLYGSGFIATQYGVGVAIDNGFSASTSTLIISFQPLLASVIAYLFLTLKYQLHSGSV